MYKRTLSIVCAALLAGCGGSDNTPTNTTTGGNSSMAKIDLTVKSPDNSPLSNVAVKIGDKASVMTDAEGKISVEVAANFDGTASLQKDGYLGKQLDVDALGAGTTASYEVTVKALMKAGEDIDFSTATALAPVKVEDPTSGASVSIGDNNAFVDDDNVPYTGPVDVFITPVDVTLDSSERGAFPGEFRGIVNGESEARDILSYGMADFTFTDQEGNELQLADGVQAEIDIPIFQTEVAAGLEALVAGATVPMWFYDYVDGVWKENPIDEGTVTEVTADGETKLVLRGTVDHFTPWNSDAWEFPYSRIRTRVWCDAEMTSETASAQVRIDAVGMSSSYTVTTGGKVGPAPAGRACISVTNIDPRICNPTPPSAPTYAPVCLDVPGRPSGDTAPSVTFDLAPSS